MDKFLSANGMHQLLFYYQEPEHDKESGKYKDTIPNWFSLCFTMALHAISTYFKN